MNTFLARRSSYPRFTPKTVSRPNIPTIAPTTRRMRTAVVPAVFTPEHQLHLATKAAFLFSFFYCSLQWMSYKRTRELYENEEKNISSDDDDC